MEILRTLIDLYRKLPVKPLRGPLSRVYRRVAARNRGRKVIAKRNGLVFELDLRELIDSAIYYNGCFEPDTTAAIAEQLRPGMTVLDIGANMGCHTLSMAQLVGPAGRVIAFEPISVAIGRLQRNIALNDFTNVTIEKLALSDRPGGLQTVRFCASWPTEGGGDLPSHPVHHGVYTEETVEVTTVDDYVASRQLGKVHFIKLDVDGLEYRILKGAANTLASHRPAMLIEFGKYTLADYGDTLESEVGFLESLGYSFFATGDPTRMSGEQIIGLVPADHTVNVLCLA